MVAVLGGSRWKYLHVWNISSHPCAAHTILFVVTGPRAFPLTILRHLLEHLITTVLYGSEPPILSRDCFETVKY